SHGELAVIAGIRRGGQLDGHEVGQRGAGVAAFRERPLAAEEEHAAAALVDELGDHPELFAREETRLDAADDEGAVLEEFLAGDRKPALEFLAVIDVQAEELVLGRPLQNDELQLFVVRDRPTHELDFETRLALEVQDLLTPVAD